MNILTTAIVVASHHQFIKDMGEKWGAHVWNLADYSQKLPMRRAATRTVWSQIAQFVISFPSFTKSVSVMIKNTLSVSYPTPLPKSPYWKKYISNILKDYQGNLLSADRNWSWEERGRLCEPVGSIMQPMLLYILSCRRFEVTFFLEIFFVIFR